MLIIIPSSPPDKIFLDTLPFEFFFLKYTQLPPEITKDKPITFSMTANQNSHEKMITLKTQMIILTAYSTLGRDQ